MRVFLDLDGVCADFNKSFSRLSGGVHPADYKAEHGSQRFWDLIDSEPDFFDRLEKMEGTHELVLGILTITGDLPIVLTACPKTRRTTSAIQKITWVRDNIHPGVTTITMHGVKGPYCENPEDVLIDDFDKHKDSWEKRGGIFIHHLSAGQTLAELEKAAEFQPIRAAVA